MDRIRRRIQETKRKATLRDITAKQNLDYLLSNHIQLPITSLKNALTVLPAIPSTHSHSLSTAHSDRHRDGDYCQSGFDFSLLERMHHSLLIPKERAEGKKCKRRTTLDCSASRAPTIQLQWQRLKNDRSCTDRMASRKPALSQMPTVIILDPQTTFHPAFSKQPTVTTNKRPSLLNRRAYAVPADLSPLRKLSISAWDAPDEVSLPT